MYSKVLDENFIEEYKSNHKILFRELNIMLSDIAFLNECILHQDLMFDTSIIIVYLFKNTFEYLILKVYRIMFDRGVDVLTIDTFANQIINNLKDEEFKSNLIHEISRSSWKSDNIKAVKRRVNESVGEFRDKAIAHKLTKNMKDYSVDLSDISVLLDAAINIFNTLSFYPLDFYNPKITKHSYIAERLVVQEKSKQLLDLLFFSSRDIKKLMFNFVIW